jgi:hypothetical protein
MENKIELKCNVCRKPFLKRLAVLKAQNKAKPQVSFYCSTECQRNRSSSIKYELSCLECGKEIKVNSLSEFKRKKFCNNSCSAAYSNIRRLPKQETRICKRCNNQFLIDKSYPRQECETCDRISSREVLNGLHCQTCKDPLGGRQKKFCSKRCAQDSFDYSALGKIGGKKSAEKLHRRSKNEIYMADLCISEYKNVITNKPCFNGWDADIILPDLKIAILWNGIWHYRKITFKHNLHAVQSRDALKISEIKKCGYIPYVIEDRGKENKKFVLEQFEKFKELVKENKLSESNI